MSSTTNHLMVAALDFGTTYSGYAFSMKHEFMVDPLTIHANQAWNSGGLLSLKTPTCLLLDAGKNFVAFGYEAENKYADFVLDEKQDDYFYFHRFKMKLHNNKNITSDMVLEDIRRKPILAVDVFSLSIKALVDHLMKLFEQRGTCLKMTDVQWVLTVPAIWNDAAKEFMRKSAEKAGIPKERLLLALEPEAASIFCQYLRTAELLGDDNEFTIFEPGTRYMVVDLGGGTVDITVHEKTEGGQLEELHRATGNYSGGTSVDEKFLQLLGKIFGESIISALKVDGTSAYLDIGRAFETVKRLIEPSMEDKVNIAIPYSWFDTNCLKLLGKNLTSVILSSPLKEEISLRGDKMRIAAHLMKSLFENTIKNIVSLMREVMKDKAVAHVSRILLVGGFARCLLVQNDIKRAFDDVRVIIPSECDLAVLKGAVLFGHKPDYVQSRAMRFTYGVESMDTFDHQKHDRKYLELVEGVERCDKTFFICGKAFYIFVKKNQIVTAGTAVKREFYTIYKFQSSMSLPVFVSTSENPVYTDENGCTKLCEFAIDLPNPCEEKRWVNVDFIFGNTEIGVTATDRNSGKEISTKINII